MKPHRPAIALLVAALLSASPHPVLAEPAPVAATSAAKAPRLIVAIAVDQFSSDLFAQYRSHFTGGLARLTQGAVFPAGYQSHAATETCPGHSTILTGAHPSRTGIIANTWFDLSLQRDKKAVYCAEDETTTAADPNDYVASANHLLVPTLGEWMKQSDPAARNIAVSGKDRGALMMGGHAIDQVYWWKGKGFTTLEGRQSGPTAIAENVGITATLASGSPEYALPVWCAGKDRAVQAGSQAIGTGRFALKPNDANGFRVSPRLDRATLDLALRLVAEQGLGNGKATDLLAVSLSASDYVGHAYGTEGTEMCIQMTQLDAALGDFFAALDARGIDYGVVLTADHGGSDLPERLHEQALPAAARASQGLTAEALSKRIGEKLGLHPKGPLLRSEGPAGDFYIDRTISAKQKRAVVAEFRRIASADPQVAAVFSSEELAAAKAPAGSPEIWSLLERARYSFHASRSGDLVVLLKRGVIAMPEAHPGYVATHGSPWDYDRRVPILFWRKDMVGFEQPNPVETVDIAPTLAAWIGLTVPAGAFDGRCLDLDAGPADSCKVAGQ